MRGVKHHLTGVQTIKSPINSSDFVSLAKPILNKLWNQNKIPILVGGSGFYIRALLKGMYSSEQDTNVTEQQKNTLNKILTSNDEKNNRELINFLEKNDPESLQNIHINDFYRLSRAVEFFYL